MRILKTFAADKVWVITGAANGIGLEMARLAAQHHGIVWALDRDEEGLARLVEEAGKQSWDVFTVALDVTDQNAVNEVIARIRQASRRIDVWVNNAGIQRVGSFTSLPQSDFDLVMKINLLAVIEITRAVALAMEQQGSGIVLNMASTAGHVPAPFMTAYVAAKHGVVGFSKALQAEFELLKSPVRVAFASPGFVDTSIIDRGKERGFPEWLAWMLSDAKTCARDILAGLARGANEIHPTLTGSMMRKIYGVAPKTTVRGSKVLLTKGFKDLLLNRYQVPR